MGHITILSCDVAIFSLCFLYVVKAAYKDGDVILGGLFNIHQLHENSNGQCGELDTKGMGRAQAMIFAIETINKDSNLLPNITLGYDIRDYCENVTKATQMTYELTKNKYCVKTTRSNTNNTKPIMALIGPFESRTALVIGEILQMLNVSSISGTTTSPELSSYNYKHLYRTVPPDTFLAKAMADIIDHFNWTYVAAVGLDDSYGRNGVWSLVQEAAARKGGSFCIAMTGFIPHENQFPSIRDIVTSLLRQENIRVVILWTYGSYQMNFFREVNRQNLIGRVWILSEVSLTSKIFLNTGFFTINESIGFQPRSFYDAGLKEHMIELLTNNTHNHYAPEWWSEVRALTLNCSVANMQNIIQHGNDQNALCSQAVVHDMYGSNIPYVIDAVYSVAHALDVLAKETNMTDNHCRPKANINLCDMQRLISRVNFLGLTGNVTFNEFGDRGSAIYDIVNFRQGQEADGKRLKQFVVGTWKANGNSTRLLFHGKMHWKSSNGAPPKSECLDQCSGGTRKAITSPCCWQCVPCPGGTINPIPGSENCIECPKEKRTNEARTECVDLPFINMKYSSSGGMVILVFIALGIVGTLFSFAIFCRFWNTAIVKASNRELSLALLVIILSLLSLAFINLFEPTDTICKVVYPWRYITYNLCLSFLLIKVLRISSVFNIPIAPSCTITNLSNRMQAVIVITLQALLLLVLLPWLLLDPPVSMKHIVTEHYIFIECKAYNFLPGKSLFLLTFSYVFLQMLLCAFSSFKIRNIPENLAAYKDGDVILGGLFNIHQLHENSNGQCGELDTKGMGRAQAMIFAIETINKDSNLLPNITLGYDIRDYCENVTKATQMTYELTKNKTSISGTTTSPELSSYNYKHLYRTVPPDTFLAKAMADIIDHFNWTYVAAVGLDDSYGRNGVWSLVKEAAARKGGSFCIAMTGFIPHEKQFPSIRDIVTSLLRQENIRVVILWTYGSYQMNFFRE
ncbi:hypothetical protein OS493_031045, partial [Desmophyllum pertusum]